MSLIPESLVLAQTTSRGNFVDLDVPLWAWVGLGVTLALMLTVDLIRHRDDHEPSPREAAVETLVWISFGLAFSAVMAILFSSMAIPLKYQHRVLFWGIFGALALRLVFILVGSALISRFFWLLIVFGLFLVYTGVKIIRHRDDEGDDARTTGLGLLKRIMPVSDTLDGHKFLTRVNAKRAATPLLAALVVVEITDVIFALDSVPAVLAVSNEPFIVFAANAFAILGLRAMYFLLANARQRFHYLSHALGGVLVFVGIKMTFSHWVHVNTYLSLAVILTMLVLAVILSERKTRQLGADRAPAPLN